ncbi:MULTISPECIES: carbon-nitrogen hydrolase family protein [unclassified Micromonospora]|uniref:carbon-nitrogen hydrolase family protein n=1 Tax=unclassified Micromonospora TaxID=2617518 RepID=UPI0022B602AF|nr:MULTISPECIES: carbon-nitrogen hydrolase family protein [unclassified Micromonospora]MCZ7423224.1 carbon-nitrogen hydrolase family protein [Verrucosispora sp. WMMA2121]WBB90912.1 carbon-nitrogen hydrolase family protein [Verrucosispora sp. WMMC514]
MPRPPLTVAVAQPPCVSYDVATNVAAHAAIVRAAATRVVVFPELSLTGYELDAAPVDPADPRLAPLVAACTAAGTVALVGAPVAGEHIATLAVDGTGVQVAYRKMWLGDVEARRFRPGPAPVVLDVDGWRIGLAICKDTGVVAHAEQTCAAGVDVYAASIVDAAAQAHVPDQRALRISTTHRVAVAVASFAGATGGGYTETAGRSAIWSSDGSVLARAGTAPGEFVQATLT